MLTVRRYQAFADLAPHQLALPLSASKQTQTPESRKIAPETGRPARPVATILEKANAMKQIITGRFHTQQNADSAAVSIAQYLLADHISVTVDENLTADPDGAGASALSTAVAAGLAAGAVGAVGGPVVALAAAGTAAYVGSLVGALNGLQDHHHGLSDSPMPELAHRTAAIEMTVRVDNVIDAARVVASMRAADAEDVAQKSDQTEDFNRLTTLQTAESGSN